MAAFNTYRAGTQSVYFAKASAAPARALLSTLSRVTVAISAVIPSRIEGGSCMFKKNTSAKIPFKAVDSSGAGLTGLAITAKTGKDGANPTAASNAVVESGQGWYYITLTSTEMNGDIVVLDLSASGATIAPIAISTESDYTAARAANLDAAISSRSTYAGGDTAGTTTLLGRITSTRAGNLDHLDADISSRSTYAGGAVASVTAAVTVGTNNDKTGYSLSAAGVQAIWDALTAAMTTANSIGKKLADWVVGTLTSGERTAIANEVEAQIIDETDSEKVLTAITDKIAAVNPDLSGLTLSAIASSVWSAGTRQLTSGANIVLAKGTGVTGFNDLSAAQVNAEADTALADVGLTATITGRIDASVSSRLAGIDYVAPLTAAGTRSALGLASANLDTQLADLPTATENADALLDRDMAVGADNGSPSVRTPRQALRFLRNKWSIDGSTLTVTKEDDATTSWTSQVATSAGAEPVVGNDPA